jgi:hypothetical protein
MKCIKLSTLSIVATLAIFSQSASAGVLGFLGNFDVMNDTGYTAHRVFQDYTLGSTFGVKVIYQGLFDSTNQSWDYGTPSGKFITPGDNCLSWCCVQTSKDQANLSTYSLFKMLKVKSTRYT